MDEPVAGPPAWFDWRGVRWYRTRSGHYQDASGQLLHRFVAGVAREHGDRRTNDVHHLDGDPSNNTAANLAVVSRSEHAAAHDLRGVAVWTEEERRAATTAMWAARQPRPVTCAECGDVFHSTGMRARFCSDRCRAADRRARVRAGAGALPGL